MLFFISLSLFISLIYKKNTTKFDLEIHFDMFIYVAEGLLKCKLILSPSPTGLNSHGSFSTRNRSIHVCLCVCKCLCAYSMCARVCVCVCKCVCVWCIYPWGCVLPICVFFCILTNVSLEMKVKIVFYSDVCLRHHWKLTMALYGLIQKSGSFYRATDIFMSLSSYIGIVEKYLFICDYL